MGETAKKDKSAKKDKNEKKFSFSEIWSNLKGEFKKIIWPTLPTVVRNTGVTLAMCAVLGIAICLFDFGLGALIKLMV